MDENERRQEINLDELKRETDELRAEPPTLPPPRYAWQAGEVPLRDDAGRPFDDQAAKGDDNLTSYEQQEANRRRWEERDAQAE